MPYKSISKQIGTAGGSMWFYGMVFGRIFYTYLQSVEEYSHFLRLIYSCFSLQCLNYVYFNVFKFFKDEI